MAPLTVLYDSIQPMVVVPDTLWYDLFDTSLGLLLVAVTEVGPCLVTLVEGEEAAQAELAARFSGSSPVRCQQEKGQSPSAASAENRAVLAGKIQAVKSRLLGGGLLDASPLMFHLNGTDFQLRVWQELLQVPWGQTITYGELATRIGEPTASRAVGNAVGENPIFCLIPCHRVIRADGSVGHYRWGTPLKQLLLESER